ncbi:MAG: glycosyltransferase [Thalassobaculum sp.]|uniref:glycosyltransferase n=1 Tax=Thalassobaculum sp. TaxID=2022740 RepID=UPI0032EED367
MAKASSSGMRGPVGDEARFDVAVVTTAALPWRTGPAYLSLWHACGLAEMGLRTAYVVPWVGIAGQNRLWGRPDFATPAVHAEWLAGEAARLGCPPLPDVFHYRAHGSALLRSIVPLQDVFAAVPPTDVVVLAEPEHLCWYPFTRPRRRVAAKTVAGLIMTNYEHYLHGQFPPALRGLAPLVTRIHRSLVRRHTDWVVPLSPAVADVAAGHPTRQARVTGVLAPYARVPPVRPGSGGAYFIGRLVWDKGLETVIDVARRLDLPVDVLGDGPDAAAIRGLARDRAAPVRFLGVSPAPWEQLPDYRVFLNPSVSEVLCTATADALVAGRHVVMADCPANQPFRPYPNAHFFTDIEGAVATMRRAMAEQPDRPDAVRRDFDWRNACRTLASLWADSGESGPR